MNNKDMPAYPVAITLENAPIGTQAPAIMGGAWVKTERGWNWPRGGTFPRPGGDWTGKLIPPKEAALAELELETKRLLEIK